MCPWSGRNAMSTIVSKGPLKSLTRWLDENHVDYEVHEHERSLTALATARAEGVDPKSFAKVVWVRTCLLYTSPSPRDRQKSRMPSSA
jgi:hypothetical protein